MQQSASSFQGPGCETFLYSLQGAISPLGSAEIASCGHQGTEYFKGLKGYSHFRHLWNIHRIFHIYDPHLCTEQGCPVLNDETATVNKEVAVLTQLTPFTFMVVLKKKKAVVAFYLTFMGICHKCLR